VTGHLGTTEMRLGDGARELTSEEIQLVSGGILSPRQPDGGHEPKGPQDGPLPNPGFRIIALAFEFLGGGSLLLKQK
jgi:hypothetical protein